VTDLLRLDPGERALLAAEVAREVVALLRADPATSQPELVDALEIARRFGVSAAWARENSARLGAVRLGDGPRARMRFDPERVAVELNRRSASVRSAESGSGSTSGPEPVRRRQVAGGRAGQLPTRSVNPSSLPEKTPRRGRSRPGPTPRSSPSTPPKRSPAGSRSAERGRPLLDVETERSRNG
jgi:hypothetical protein